MESNIILTGASIYLDFVSKLGSKVSIENITFINCYGQYMGCIYAFTKEKMNLHFLQIKDIYLHITQVNWLTAFQEHFNNLSEVNKKYSDSISKYSQSSNSECMGYILNYFEFKRVTTEVLNFQLLDTNVEFNEYCIPDMITFPSFFLYYNINLASFGQSIVYIQKDNISPTILTTLPDPTKNCIYDQITLKSKVT